MAKKISMICVFLMLAQTSFAEAPFVKLRVFSASTNVNPTDLNDEMALNNIKDFKSVTKFGLDLTAELNRFMDVGLRYERTGQRSLEIVPTAGQNFQATLIQESLLGVARTTFLKTDVFRGDAFVGAGAASTKFALASATQDGRLSSNGYNSIVGKAGASIGIGLLEVFLFLEGGYDYNVVNGDLEREENMNNHISKLDLSGTYISGGLLFEGVTGHK